MGTTERIPGIGTYPVFRDTLPGPDTSHRRYSVRFASTPDELERVFRLRFEVFNVELGEGLDASWRSGRDIDEFDAGCHHLMVTDERAGQLIGTYRLQTREMAVAHRGFYSDGEFDLSALPDAILDAGVELSRACIHEAHRNQVVLFLLWRGLARYVEQNGKRYLFGCCSLTSQDPVEGRRVHAYLREQGHLHPEICAPVRTGLGCEGPEPVDGGSVKLPKLFRTYVRHGARVCSPPALDREFKTIDFLVLFEIGRMDRTSVRLFFS